MKKIILIVCIVLSIVFSAYAEGASTVNVKGKIEKGYLPPEPNPENPELGSHDGIKITARIITSDELDPGKPGTFPTKGSLNSVEFSASEVNIPNANVAHDATLTGAIDSFYIAYAAYGNVGDETPSLTIEASVAQDWKIGDEDSGVTLSVVNNGISNQNSLFSGSGEGSGPIKVTTANAESVSDRVLTNGEAILVGYSPVTWTVDAGVTPKAGEHTATIKITIAGEDSGAVER